MSKTLTDNERELIKLANKAYVDFKKLKSVVQNGSTVESVINKLTDCNLALARVQPYVIIFMVEMDYFSTAALERYLISIRREDHRTAAQRILSEQKFKSDQDQMDAFAREMVNQQAQSHLRYFSYLVRDFVRSKGQHLNTGAMKNKMNEKLLQIKNDLNQRQLEQQMRQEEAERQTQELNLQRRNDVIRWFQAALSRPDYEAELNQTTNLQDKTVICTDVY